MAIDWISETIPLDMASSAHLTERYIQILKPPVPLFCYKTKVSVEIWHVWNNIIGPDLSAHSDGAPTEPQEIQDYLPNKAICQTGELCSADF